jgi:ABC-type polysaccharide/polyol phosphate export permease
MRFESQLLADSVASLRVWRVWWFLGTQDIKARFRRSFLGPLWIFLNMFLFVAGVGVLYGVLINQPMREFLPYLVTGLALWGMLVASFTESGWSFVNAEGYIKQFCYPKQIYLLRTLVSTSIILVVTLTAVFRSWAGCSPFPASSSCCWLRWRTSLFPGTSVCAFGIILTPRAAFCRWRSL